MGIEAIYPKMNLSRRNFERKVYPYLLRDVPILYPNHVWSADITYMDGWSMQEKMNGQSIKLQR
jgi:putative transposase